MRIAIVPGSFDPMTLGHLDIIKRAADLYDRVIVAVMINDSKRYTFSMEERTEIARLTCKDIENVEVISDAGLLADLAKRVGACAIVKGVRDEKDYEYEKEMAGIYSTCVVPDTLDESPMAYKSMEEIVANIEPTAEIIRKIKPIYNFKASE